MTVSSDQMLTGLENERRYVARELHDGVAQTTLQLNLQIGICRKLLERDQQEKLAGELAELEQRIQLAATQIRQMIADMRPPKVAPEATLDEYFQYIIELHFDRGGPFVAYHFELEQPPAISPNQSLALTRVAQECLLNIRKHAQATQVQLHVSGDATQLQLKISDNGQGFDLAEVQTRPIDKGGAGLTNLQARVEAIGGALTITSQTGQGTQITVTLPK